MGRRISPQRIKKHLVYTPFEVAQALGVHRQTIIRWVREKGLVADTSSKPWLIRGEDLKAHLMDRSVKRKTRLALHQLYCMRCKEAREPAGRVADYTHQTDATGRLTALCEECLTVLNKIVRRPDLEIIRTKVEVTIKQADPRLVLCEEPGCNVTISKEAQANAKASSG